MKDDTLDQILKGKLEHLSVPTPEDAWEAFEQKLNATEPGVPQPDDTLIDQIVFDKLHQYEAVRPNSGWHLLRHRMNTRTAITYRIASWKTAEAIILSLLLLLVTRLSLPTTIPTSPVAGQDSGQATPGGTFNPTVLPLPPARPGTSDSNAPTPSVSPLPPTNEASQAQNNATANARPARTLFRLPAKRTQTLRSITASSTDSPHLLIPEQPVANQSDSGMPFIDDRPAALVVEAQNAAPWTNLITPLSKTQVYVGMYADIAYNRIITPPDLNNDIIGFDRYSLGYGGGFSLGIRKGSFEIGSGMAYHAIRYEPIPLLVTRGFFNQGYTTEKFDFVELNIISVPLYIQYDLLDKEGWRFYATTGAALNVAYETNFYAVFPEDLGLPSGLRPTPRQQSSFGNRFGWFEGGSFRENSYFTLNLGVGLERSFAERWSMFLQPTYLRNLGYYSDGMGPTHDRIHTMSILTGIRVQVKR